MYYYTMRTQFARYDHKFLDEARLHFASFSRHSFAPHSSAVRTILSSSELTIHSAALFHSIEKCFFEYNSGIQHFHDNCNVDVDDCRRRRYSGRQRARPRSLASSSSSAPETHRVSRRDTARGSRTVGEHGDSRGPLPMLNARRGIRGRELMPASSSYTAATATANANAGFRGPPHNESTLRRASSDRRASTGRAVFSF